MTESSNHFGPAKGVIAEPSGQRTVILDAKGKAVSTLSPVGSLVWQLLPSDLPSLVDRLQATFPDIEREQLLVDVQHFLRELLDADLVIEVDAAG